MPRTSYKQKNILAGKKLSNYFSSDEKDELIGALLREIHYECGSNTKIVKKKSGINVDLYGDDFSYEDSVDGFFYKESDVEDAKFDKNTHNNINKDMTFGVEIECLVKKEICKEFVSIVKNTKNEVIDVKEIINTNNKPIPNKIKLNKKNVIKLNKYFTSSNDGSLRTYRNSDLFPIEFKSHILNGDLGLDIIKLFYKTINPEFNNSCGIHIHIGTFDITKNNLIIDESKVNKLSYLIDYIIAPFFQSEERYNSNGNGFAKKQGDIYNHYSACSLSGNYHTVEFRHLNGVSAINLIKYIVILTNLFSPSNTNFNIDNIDKSIKKIITLNGKIKYSDRKKTYKAYMSEEKKQAFRIAKSLIFNK